MKFSTKLVFSLGFLTIINFAWAQSAPKKMPVAAKKTPTTVYHSLLKNSSDSLSYAIGLNIADNLKSQKININSAVLAAALEDVKNNRPTAIKSEEGPAYIGNYFQKQAAKAGLENKTKGEAFLAKNKTETGVITTVSGLQYKIIKEADGPKPLETDKVKVHYHGTTIDGKVFDSSVDRGEPAVFGVNQVIKGWVEALQLMPVGSKWKLFIPADLAYGLQAPPAIGPSQVLIFDVELLGIEK